MTGRRLVANGAPGRARAGMGGNAPRAAAYPAAQVVQYNGKIGAFGPSSLPPVGAPRPMCGIAGYVNAAGRPAERAIVETMTATLAHRGPDGDGFHVRGPVALGHRRLSIIDVS